MVFFQVSKAVGLGISEGCVGPIGWPAFFEVLSFLERLAKRTAVGSWRFFRLPAYPLCFHLGIGNAFTQRAKVEIEVLCPN